MAMGRLRSCAPGPSRRSLRHDGSRSKVEGKEGSLRNSATNPSRNCVRQEGLRGRTEGRRPLRGVATSPPRTCCTPGRPGQGPEGKGPLRKVTSSPARGYEHQDPGMNVSRRRALAYYRYYPLAQMSTSGSQGKNVVSKGPLRAAATSPSRNCVRQEGLGAEGWRAEGRCGESLLAPRALVVRQDGRGKGPRARGRCGRSLQAPRAAANSRTQE